ncbi:MULTISPECIES: hypothetical protein [unclassified Bradyrhizobium]|uniref:hypothetical protein n=1 Tax=unclassified Bradyrhizobium TaxID=2631580 RepID=UPI002916B20E|nr:MULTISPECIES: hypothetical protein [unclassified Bradyrhizobium]
MPATAFSAKFGRELDVDQLAVLITGLQPTSERDGAELLGSFGEAIRADIQCSSCGKLGARVLRSAKSRASRAFLRQAHFRFVDPDGGDAHHPFCEFYGDDENRSSQASLLDFGSEKSTETRAVRVLVCKGIEQGLFDQRRIRAMRRWFFDVKSASRFTLTTTREALSWTRALHRHPSYQRWRFHPAQADMPAFNWKAAAKYQFTEDNLHLFDLIKGVKIDDGICRQAGELLRKHYQREVFDPTILQSNYDAAVSLSGFVARNSGIDFGRVRPEYFRLKGPPTALRALCALLLFVSNWDIDAAITAFARLVLAPSPSDLALGNVIGLNPFHEYAAWRLVIVSAQVAAESPNGLDYGHQLAQAEAALRQQHRRWKER